MKRFAIPRLFLAISFVALTAILIVRMLWLLHLSVSNALQNDQWIMLEEIRQLQEHKVNWTYLWAPYWGHRIVIPRLLLLADERWLRYSNTPLVLINVLAQFGSAAILGVRGWQLLRRAPLDVRILAVTGIANLVLSSIQVENIVYGMAVQNTVAFVSAIGALAIMSSGEAETTSMLRCTLAIVCAAVSALCLGVGLLLWPVMILQGVLLRVRSKLLAVLSVTGTLAVGVYLHGYTGAPMGMGVIGALRRPLKSAVMAGVLLGGPFSDVHIWQGELAGIFGLLLTLYLTFRAFQVRTRASSPEFSFFVSVLLFIAGCAFSMAAARISPEWLAQHPKPLPSRYLSFALIFWAGALPLALSDLKYRGFRTIAAVTTLVVSALIFEFIPLQLYLSDQWLKAYRFIDSAASGLIVGALDQTDMSCLYADDSVLARDVPFLRERRLSVFNEQRAEWFANALSIRFHVDPRAKCSGRIEAVVPTATRAVRITGWVEGAGVDRLHKSDVLFTDSTGKIWGIGRTIADGEHGHDRFLGYASGAGPMNAWLVEANQVVCWVGSL